MKTTSWKTLVAGIIGSIGAYLITVPDPSWIPTIGKILVGLSPVLLGWFARDDDKTSEQVGAGK